MIRFLATVPTPREIHEATDSWSGGAVVLLLVIIGVAWLLMRRKR